MPNHELPVIDSVPAQTLPARAGSTLGRRLVAEFAGTAALAAVVIGSGIAAEQLSPGDIGLQLLENSTASAFGLAVLILAFGPISGAHLNPVVSLADWLSGRRGRSGLTTRDLGAYVAAQCGGAVFGALLANAMFDRAVVQIASHHRVTGGHLIGEMLAAAGLIVVGFAAARHGRGVGAVAVATYIGSAIWFTSSGSFANPALTLGRMFSDSFTGIAPASVPAFVVAQIVGGLAGLSLMTLLYRPTADR
ncbi:MIP/aquaporin family protein [Nocardia sp. CDC153]|uniref:MIP/aquaporin family protein n=1 Tax=Nocardia sp. CDC153 TaxID=3112167 RepID=UPI002DBE77A4|nr:MIP/aquaporin family protein [Nocardia sp. CDC153]MEC3956590.1 MIP/aquaporin family protein [Nocardia sp. CDC153]